MTRAVRYALRVARDSRRRAPITEADRKRQAVRDAAEKIREKD